jgi:multiple sugar transport system permease protein
MQRTPTRPATRVPARTGKHARKHTGGVPPGRAPERPPARGARWFQRQGFWLLLMLPALAFLVVSQFYPLLDTARVSLFDDRPTRPGPAEFVGLDNYVELLTEDRRFWTIVRSSFIWMIGSTLLQMVLGTAAAMVLNLNLRLRALWRGLLMVPWVTPVVVVAIIWRWMFDGRPGGLINFYLERAGAIDDPIVWLASDTWVWPVLLLASTWKGLPFVALIVLAALQSVPKDVLEAAEVDGANRVQRFRYVTLPHLRPTLFVTGLIALVTVWFKFELIWALTKGGPGFATSILPTYVYQQAFRDFDFGMGGAVATIAMVLLLLFVGLYALLFRQRRTREG